MKMMICIVQDHDKDIVVKALNEAQHRVTVLPSSGAFFRRGNATLMIGMEDQHVDEVIEVLKNNTRESDIPNLKRVTLFVMDVDRFEQI